MKCKRCDFEGDVSFFCRSGYKKDGSIRYVTRCRKCDSRREPASAKTARVKKYLNNNKTKWYARMKEYRYRQRLRDGKEIPEDFVFQYISDLRIVEVNGSILPRLPEHVLKSSVSA